MVFALFFSCKESENSKINKMVSVPIHLSIESFERIDGKFQTTPFEVKDYKFIVFADSTECMSCSITKMHKWNPFCDSLLMDYDISFMYILSPVIQDYNTVREKLLHNRLSFPVFLDKNNNFAKINKNIPSASLYHVFILDKNNNIIYLGDPREKENLSKILFKSIACLRKT